MRTLILLLALVCLAASMPAGVVVHGPPSLNRIPAGHIVHQHVDYDDDVTDAFEDAMERALDPTGELGIDVDILDHDEYVVEKQGPNGERYVYHMDHDDLVDDDRYDHDPYDWDDLFDIDDDDDDDYHRVVAVAPALPSKVVGPPPPQNTWYRVKGIGSKIHYGALPNNWAALPVIRPNVQLSAPVDSVPVIKKAIEPLPSVPVVRALDKHTAEVIDEIKDRAEDAIEEHRDRVEDAAEAQARARRPAPASPPDVARAVARKRAEEALDDHRDRVEDAVEANRDRASKAAEAHKDAVEDHKDRVEDAVEAQRDARDKRAD